MAASKPTPWNFSNEDKNLFSPAGHYRLEYSEPSEIAMGSSIGGSCFLIYPDDSTLKLHGRAGGACGMGDGRPPSYFSNLDYEV